MFVDSSSSMIPLLFILVNPAQSVYAIQTNSTTTGLPQPSGSGTLRTIWGILGSCAVTLLICVWHALHFDIDYSWSGPDDFVGRVPQTSVGLHLNLEGLVRWILGGFCDGPVGLVLRAIFGPEVVIANAVMQWWRARLIVAQFREQGYQWSMTHCFFAEMGGFLYRDKNGDSRTIKSPEFLQLCKENKIANPLITVKEIRDKSKSDALAKAIFAAQLLWFVVQVVARACSGFAITLLEIDTVSMAVLALIILWFWWDKPHSPRCPHVFYSPQDVRPDPNVTNLMKKTWRPEPSCLFVQLTRLSRKTEPATADDEIPLINGQEGPVRPINNTLSNNKTTRVVGFYSLCASWLILGGLHLIAWDFHFPTEAEKILWRVASLILTGSSIAFLALFHALVVILSDMAETLIGTTIAISGILGIVARVLLIALMLASLRALPPSAYETVAWTAFIPHL